jgi:Ca-activated chloride channel family protein
MKRYVTLLIICLPFLVGAQQLPGGLKGTVKDEITKESIPFASVRVLLGDELVAGASTDFDGNYIIAPLDHGKYTVTFENSSYTKRRISVAIIPGKVKVLNIEMSVEEQVLDEIVLTDHKLIEVGKTSTIMRSESIHYLPYRSNTGIGAVTPGVQVGNDGNLRFRGARSGNNQTFIDGVKVRGDANIPREAIAQQQVMQSGLPAQYGESNTSSQMKHRIQKDVSRVYQYQIASYHQNTEEYIPIYENNFEVTHGNPLSTFSIDVDGASYANTRRFLENGSLPPQDAVRIEEFVNYFNYDYTQPEGEHPISVYTEVADCPWNIEHQLVHIGLKGKDVVIDKDIPQNLVFLLDVSGSMSDNNKLPLVKSALKLLIKELNPEDKISIVVYAGASGLALPPTKVEDETTILNALDRLNSGGSTAGGAGIELAYKVGLENFSKKGNNRIILCTDGDFNVGISDRNQLVKLIEKKRESGLFLSVLGFGTGNLHDATMEQLADKGNGNYNYIDNLKEARKVLVHEMNGTLMTIAKDVKLQLEFNPTNVKAYRLIGYENRVLADRDFNDDTKDAGEIGSSHSVTAIYEVIPVGALTSVDKEIDELKYASQLNASFSDELLTVKIRYKNPDEDKSVLLKKTVKAESTTFKKSSENMRFSAAVASYGMLIRGSQFSGTTTFDDILDWAKSAKGEDEFGYRSEFLQLVRLTDDIIITEVSEN